MQIRSLSRNNIIKRSQKLFAVTFVLTSTFTRRWIFQHFCLLKPSFHHITLIELTENFQTCPNILSGLVLKGNRLKKPNVIQLLAIRNNVHGSVDAESCSVDAEQNTEYEPSEPCCSCGQWCVAYKSSTKSDDEARCLTSWSILKQVHYTEWFYFILVITWHFYHILKPVLIIFPDNSISFFSKYANILVFMPK